MVKREIYSLVISLVLAKGQKGQLGQKDFLKLRRKKTPLMTLEKGTL
jgi:hypothetical protein